VSYPRIVGVTRTPLSRWATVVEKQVQFAEGQAPEVYHCLTQADYVGILAVTGDGLVPIVRQFRPAVEGFTWEFPAGTLEPGESPETAARRELLEETGMVADDLVPLGALQPDTGRMDVHAYGFFARVSRSPEPVSLEPGLDMRLVTMTELRDMIRKREFAHLIHLGLFAAALVDGVCPELAL
jgi:ADP-ribose pyrophosphatase